MTTSYEVNFLFVHEFCICQIEHWMDHIAPYFRHQITEIDKQITVETLFVLFVATEEAIPHTPLFTFYYATKKKLIYS